MKKRVMAAVFCAILVLTFTFGVDAFDGAAKNHGKLMKNEDYAGAYEGMAAVMAEAKDRLDAEEYKALEQENAKAIAESVREDMESGGSTEAEAYSTAYWMRSEYVSRCVLVWDWLRKNPKGIQGYYRLMGSEAEGYVTIMESGEKDVYSVYFCVAMKETPELWGELDGIGKHEGNAMIVDDLRNDEVSVKLVFDGETAVLASPEKEKKSFIEEYGAAFDGTYRREKKNSR